jgi:uncharacterized protein with ACT and thioredoxin-like domain
MSSNSNIYRLVDHGYPFKKIMNGKHWVGRVYRHADTGRYHGKINAKVGGGFEVEAATEAAAFNEVVSRVFGFTSAAEMDAHNAAVRAKNRGHRAEVKDLANRLMGGDFTVLDRLFDKS